MAAQRLIGIDARVVPGRNGGVAQALEGLAAGLSAMQDPDLEYVFLCVEGETDWIQPYLGDRLHFLTESRALPYRTANLLRRSLARITPVQDEIAVLRSSGVLERAGVDLIHLAIQMGFLTELPTVYHPHDLQHRHLPGHFSPRMRWLRDVVYGTLARRASVVVALTPSGRCDVVNELGVDPGRVAVVPWAGQLPSESDALQPEAVTTQLAIALLPASTWPHKRHIDVIEALALLRGWGVEIPVVLTGHPLPPPQELVQRADALGVADLLSWRGYIAAEELRDLYRSSRVLVFPSEFEGWGLPLVEAMHVGLPIVATEAPGIADVVGDAAALVPPRDPHSLAVALAGIWTDPAERQLIAERGRIRGQVFSWERTATMMNAIYRRVAGLPFDELAGPWL